MSNERVRARAAILAVSLLLAFAPMASAEKSPDPASAVAAREVVEQAVGDVVAVLANREWSIDKRVDEIEKIAYRTFDFPTISRLVLARNYRKFSSEQKQSFEREFRHHLSHTYGSRVDRYDQERVDIVGARVEKRGDVTVLTRIVGGPADGIEIHYRLRERSGAWKMIDVVIEGVSLVSNYRSQFKEVLGQGGPEELLRRLHRRNTPLEGDVDGKNGQIS